MQNTLPSSNQSV